MPENTASQRLSVLAVASGRTLVIAFVVYVGFGLVPLSLGSSGWGSQLSSRIVDSASLVLVGVALLCGAVMLQATPEATTDRWKAKRLANQSKLMLQLCRLGFISLVLLALWQVPLLKATTSLINEGTLNQAGQLSPVLQQAEQVIRTATPAEVEERWQQYTAARSPALQQPVSGIEQKRKALLSLLQQQQQLANQNVNAQGRRARLVNLRESLRIMAMALVYALGFGALGRSLRSAP